MLRLLTPLPTANDVNLRWQSVAGVSYFLERSTNLGASSPFLPLATNLIGQAGTTTYTDTNAVAAPPAFFAPLATDRIDQAGTTTFSGPAAEEDQAT